MDVDLRSSVLGFAVALVVLALIAVFVGIQNVLVAFANMHPVVLVGVLAAATSWLIAWGLALWTVLAVLGAEIPPGDAILTYAAATFANNVTPFGQAGGEPLSALLISRVAETEYERGLAAIASVDSLNFIPSISLAALGLAFFSTEIGFGRRLRIASGAVAVLAIAVPIAGYLIWRHRYDVERRVIDTLTPSLAWLGRRLPRIQPPSPDTIARRVEGFFHAIERITTDRTSLALALGFSTAGWTAKAVSLFLSLYALEIKIAFSIIVVVVPVAAIAGITPLPGGLGGVEAVLIALLVAFGMPAGAAGAAVLVHRTATYWLPTVVGAGIAGYLGGSDDFSLGFRP